LKAGAGISGQSCYHQSIGLSWEDIMRIGLAADHGGFTLKEGLKEELAAAGHQVVDFGAEALDPDDDYPDMVIPLALAITFLLLFGSFGTVFDSLLVLLNVPFALIGGVAGLAAAGMTLSVSAAVGFIALLGQAVLNGVLVVAAIKTRLQAGEPAAAAVAGGAQDRLRAVLITALLAALGLLPAALSHAIGSETQRPIAVVVVGGAISAAALTLVVLPVSYFWACRARDAMRRRAGTPCRSRQAR